jgi:DNA topoisomerase VI subunit B
MSDAHEMASKQREISIAEFFEKNRHLLGFDNRRKALLTTIKEAVDNSLDACEEADFLPEVNVEINQLSEFKYSVVVEDNGPGIVKAQIPKVFAKLLYGSKFFKLSQSRGQQGIGISAAVLYAQLTTGKPAKITSRISAKEPAHYYELHIDVKQNAPQILKEETIEWPKEHGTRVELVLDAEYLKGSQSVDEYIRQTAIINPHVTLTYTNPKAEQFIYARATEQLPPHPKEIRPHPYGIEIGLLMRMLTATSARALQSFLTSEFSRVGPGTAKEICENSSVLPESKPKEITRDQAEKLINGISKTKIIAPPTDCISPIGEELMERGLKKEVEAEFYCATSRPASVYRGNPFVVEAAIAYGGKIPADKAITIMRFANRVPLLYQQGACAMSESLTEVSWKPYGLQQSGTSVPSGPAIAVIHMASVWVPFTSEAKEAIAHYPEIMKEIKLALQECGRKLGMYVNKKVRVHQQLERANLFERYIPEVADSLASLTGTSKESLIEWLKKMLNKDEIKAQIEIELPETAEEENESEGENGEEEK